MWASEDKPQGMGLCIREHYPEGRLLSGLYSIRFESFPAGASGWVTDGLLNPTWGPCTKMASRFGFELPLIRPLIFYCGGIGPTHKA